MICGGCGGRCSCVGGCCGRSGGGRWWFLGRGSGKAFSVRAGVVWGEIWYICKCGVVVSSGKDYVYKGLWIGTWIGVMCRYVERESRAGGKVWGYI